MIVRMVGAPPPQHGVERSLPIRPAVAEGVYCGSRPAEPNAVHARQAGRKVREASRHAHGENHARQRLPGNDRR